MPRKAKKSTTKGKKKEVSPRDILGPAKQFPVGKQFIVENNTGTKGTLYTVVQNSKGEKQFRKEKGMIDLTKTDKKLIKPKNADEAKKAADMVFEDSANSSPIANESLLSDGGVAGEGEMKSSEENKTQSNTGAVQEEKKKRRKVTSKYGTADQIRARLQKMGLSKTGNKSQLVARLSRALSKKAGKKSPKKSPAKKKKKSSPKKSSSTKKRSTKKKSTSTKKKSTSTKKKSTSTKKRSTTKKGGKKRKLSPVTKKSSALKAALKRMGSPVKGNIDRKVLVKRYIKVKNSQKKKK